MYDMYIFNSSVPCTESLFLLFSLLLHILQITITASLFLSNTFLIIIKIYWYLLDWTVSYFDKSIFSSVISYMLDSNIYGKNEFDHDTFSKMLWEPSNLMILPHYYLGVVFKLIFFGKPPFFLAVFI